MKIEYKDCHMGGGVGSVSWLTWTELSFVKMMKQNRTAGKGRQTN
jgi:hypothetical protein